MRFPSAFLDGVRARLPVSQVCGRRVKLKRQGREWVGLSPFNQEKTPSFCVNDQKGRWFDHSAGRNGDIFAFLQETEGLSFKEAVERCAAMAGVPLPSPDPAYIKREAQKLSAIEQNEKDCQTYQRELRRAQGAYDYLRGRGVTDQSIAKFRLGYAAAGFFAGRIVFPIAGAGGILGFGGRALGDVRPKYLNSADSDLFAKGNTLYNYPNARQPAHDGAPLLVVEGYTAVIAADAAGFPATVAPMGTALTETHLLNLWRLSDSPIIAYDGDGAGRRATRRAIEKALPLLLPGRTLRFVDLPRGMDPDDVVRKQGAKALGRLVEASIGMADAFWALSVDGASLVTPEARAGLENQMVEALKVIPGRQLREKYLADAKDRIQALPRRTAAVRANGHSLHSTAPGAIRLVYGLKTPVMSINDALVLSAIVADPSAGMDAAESIAINPKLSEHTRQVASEIIYLISTLPEMATAQLMAAMATKNGLGDAVEQALLTCREAGVDATTALVAAHVLRG